MAVQDVAVLPGRGSPLGFQSWLSEMRALAVCNLRGACPPVLEGPRGDGHVVLVIPGFLTGDAVTAPMRRFLNARGFQAEPAQMRFNAGPTPRLVQSLEVRLETLAQRSGRAVSLVGQSLGGVFARGLAHRRPDLVRRVVTLCSPIRFPVTTPLQPFVWALSGLHDPHWIARREEIARTPSVPVTAIYSFSDGIVDWRQCLQDEGPLSDNVRVESAHTIVGANAEAQAIVAERLSRPPLAQSAPGVHP